MTKSYKYRLKLTENQKVFFNKSFGCSRYVYNWGLDRKISAYKLNKTSLSCFELCKELTLLKKDTDKSWLSEVCNENLQQSLRNMESAYNNFFKSKKGFPKFKSKHVKQSCRFINSIKFDFSSKRIKIPKIGWVKFYCDREFEGKIGALTISKIPSGEYFASITVQNELTPPKKYNINSQNSVGIDLGIKTFATYSTGNKVENPKYLEFSLRRLKILQRRLSKKQKGSKNRNKQKLRIAKLHYKISCQRTDFLHKLSSKIVSENQTIIIEDLNINGMMKNHSLAKYIQSVSWYEFTRQLEYKSEWMGVNLIKINRFYPSSKTCSNCGIVKENLTLSDRIYSCNTCGFSLDRDHNAAINIKNFAFKNHLIITTPIVNGEELSEMSLIKESVKKENNLKY